MNKKFLFPYHYKAIGWAILIPSILLGLWVVMKDVEPDFLDFRVPALFVEEIFGENKLFGMVKNNLLNEILGALILVSGLMVAFSKEKNEDEYISSIRLESLVWAVYVNYAILLLSLLFIYGLSFLWVMIFNMYTILIFFIIRFNWKISKLRKEVQHEE